MKTVKLIAFLFLVNILTLSAQKISIKPADALLKWTAYKIGGSHTGNIKARNASLEIKDGNISGGFIEIDMKSIRCTDLEEASYNKKLVDHLISEDFFGVEKFPTASFTITKAEKFNNGKATVSGKLTIKGKTEPINFEVTKQNNVYKTQLKVDRSKFDVRYGSNSFFDNLGNKAIENIFDLDIQITAK